MATPIIILAIVFVLIAFRQVGNIRLQIWQIMFFGAIAVLITGQITYYDALKSINLDVIIFLFCMFVIGRALEDSGYLSHMSYNYFKKVRSTNVLLLYLLFGFGALSIFLMNDTIAIIGTPVVLLLAEKYRIPPKPLLLALAFAVTTGSLASPIGNPQNLLIAINGNIQNPFISFFKFLLIPSVINLVLTYLLLKFFYGRDLCEKRINLHRKKETIKDPNLAMLSKLSLVFLIGMVFTKICLVFLDINFDLKLTYIAVLSMLPIFFSRKRFSIIEKIDWHTLVFFAAMFVLMESVWQTGFFQSVLSGLNLDIGSVPVIMATSIVLSQFMSNVPLVALYLPVLMEIGASAKELVALAAGSTIAGNLLILGAASNIIIIQNAEKRGNETITFWEFARVGIPLTLLNTLIYMLFLVVIQ